MHTDFVVDHHDRDQHGVWPDGSLKLFQRNEALLVHREIRHIKTTMLQVAATVQHTLVCSRK